jgi:hypothetical protein
MEPRWVSKKPLTDVPNRAAHEQSIFGHSLEHGARLKVSLFSYGQRNPLLEMAKVTRSLLSSDRDLIGVPLSRVDFERLDTARASQKNHSAPKQYTILFY